MDKDTSALTNKLLALAGFKPAPSCNCGCHMIDSNGKVMLTAKAVMIAASMLIKEMSQKPTAAPES